MCLFAIEHVDARAKLCKRYPANQVMTFCDRLRSSSQTTSHHKPGTPPAIIKPDYVVEKAMKPSIALELKRSSVRAAAGRFHTTNPRIFGSVVHGTDQDGSDLDLLVDALPGATLFDLGGLQVELEDLLGVHVDLLTPGDLPPKLRDRVLAEAQPV